MRQKMDEYNIGLVIGLLAAVISSNVVNYLAHRDDNIIPNQEQVQQGYISPNKLEVECKDLDGDGELETIMKVGNKSYLLREVDEKPVLSPYKIKPAEIIQKSE